MQHPTDFYMFGIYMIRKFEQRRQHFASQKCGGCLHCYAVQPNATANIRNCNLHGSELPLTAPFTRFNVAPGSECKLWHRNAKGCFLLLRVLEHCDCHNNGIHGIFQSRRDFIHNGELLGPAMRSIQTSTSALVTHHDHLARHT